MTLQELRYLIALAEKGNFVRAAEACYVTQPTLSMQIKKLEQYLGVVLFDRNNHHLWPTPIGDKIIEQARIMVNLADQIKQIANSSQDQQIGVLRLGVIPTLGPYLIPQVLAQVRQGFPLMSLYLREDRAADLLERLRKGQLDALLLAMPVNGEDIESMPLFNEEFVVAMPPGHPLAELPFIREKDLARDDLLLLEVGHCMREQVLAICHADVFKQAGHFSATSIETLRQMVAAGVGFTLLPVLTTALGVGGLNGDLVQIRNIKRSGRSARARTISLVWRRGYTGETAIMLLGKLILEQLPSMPCVTAVQGTNRAAAVERHPTNRGRD